MWTQERVVGVRRYPDGTQRYLDGRDLLRIITLGCDVPESHPKVLITGVSPPFNLFDVSVRYLNYDVGCLNDS